MNNSTQKPNISEVLKLDSGKKKVKRKPKIYWVYSVLVVLCFVIIALFAHSGPDIETAYVLNERTGSAASPILRTSGYVTYPQQIEIGTQQRGPVLSLFFEEGDQVKKGDLLAVLDNTELLVEKRLQQKIKLNAEKVLKRTQNLHQAGSASDAELESATIAYENASLNLELLDEQIEKTKIKAPVTGRMIDKSIEVGELVNGTIAEMINNSETLVEVDINQNDIAKIENDQPAVVTLDAYPKTEYAASVWKIAESGDRARNTVQVKVKVLFPDQKFKPGLSAKVYFVKNKQVWNHEIKTRLVVPKTALILEDGIQKVWLIKNDILFLWEVQTGEELENTFEIISGLSVDDKIVKNPANYSLKDGTKVGNGDFSNWLKH